MTLAQLVYRHRLAGKRAVSMLACVLPDAASRRLRAVAERVAFNITPQYQGDTLPGIFHYWSGRYLTPAARRLGIGSAEAFYLRHIRQCAMRGLAPVRVLSAGSGAASMEIELAAQLQASGVPVKMTCVDFNPDLMRRAAVTAAARGVAASMAFVTRDCNLPFTLESHDVIIVNQFFHHVTALETFCASLRRSLAADGVLLSSDVIGRNGHRLWPDVETRVQQFWEGLPAQQRYDRYYSAVQPRYRSVDHSAYSNEGVRAQDVVACLLGEFDFELFFSFGAAIMPFVERRIGFNFNADGIEDRALIDRIHADDNAALAAARYPASNMMAALRNKGTATRALYEPVSPRQHVALTRQQLAKAVD